MNYLEFINILNWGLYDILFYQENDYLFSTVCNLMQATSPAVRHDYRKREFTLAAIKQYITIDDVDLCWTHAKWLQLCLHIFILWLIISDSINFLFQRMRVPALPKSGAQTFESTSKHVLRHSDIFHSRLWRYRAGHLALATLHGYHDLRGAHSVTNTSAYF